MQSDISKQYAIHSEGYSVGVEDGILYHIYSDELNLTIVLEAEKKSLHLLNDHGIHIAPLIVLLQDIDKNRFKLTMADYGRVLSTFDLARRASGIWIVGVADEVRQTIITIGNYFLVNRIFFANNIQDAEEGARLFLSTSDSILDP